MIGGIPITKKQRYLAGRTDLVALLRSRGQTLKKLGSEWEWKFLDERVTIRGHLWFDQYTQKGGDAVDFFRYFYGESEEQAVAMLLNCSVQDLEKLPARSPPRAAPFKEREEKMLEAPPSLWKYATGIRLPVPDQGHRSGGGVRLRPGGASSIRVQTTTTLFLWAGTSKARSATSTPGEPSPAPISARRSPAARKSTASTGQVPAGNSMPLRPPSTCSPTFPCTQKGGRIAA